MIKNYDVFFNINYDVSYHLTKFKIKNQLERGETKITTCFFWEQNNNLVKG